MRHNQGRGSDPGRPARPDRDSDRSDQLGRGQPDNRPTTRASREREPTANDWSESSVTGQFSGRSAAVDTAAVTVTVLAVPQVDAREVVYDHQHDGIDPGATRPLVLFDVENTSEEPLRWRPGRTQFVGDDDYTYGTSSLALDPSAFGPGCHTRSVTIDPGRRARVVTLVEQLPDGVTIEEVGYRIHAGDERLRFQLV